jgi:hypothetical protein
MSKAKCLSNVLTDNAFLQFPVDEERYELFDALVRWVDDLADNCSEALTTVPVTVDWRIMGFFIETSSTVKRACESYIRVLKCEDAGILPPAITAERSWRLIASLKRDPLLVERRLDTFIRIDGYAPERAAFLFYAALVADMKSTPGFVRPSAQPIMDKRSST